MALTTEIRRLIESTAARYGVPLSVALSVAHQESNFTQTRPDGSVLRGGSGEYGMYQLMPGTAQELGVNASKLEDNIEGGIRYLSRMFSSTGDWAEALKAYNGGIGNWQRNTVSTAAQNYAQQVLARAQSLYGGGVSMTEPSGGGGGNTPQSAPGNIDLASWLPFGTFGASLFGGGQSVANAASTNAAGGMVPFAASGQGGLLIAAAVLLLGAAVVYQYRS